jgi:2-polyprenyl-3-methyl-5-hydroxy-6-metoxy-1,4-benzoquinol methylase
MFKFGKNVDKKIKSLIQNLPKNGKVLDLGMGLGGNSIFLAERGFGVTCLDKDKEVIKIIKKEYPRINAFNKNILEFNFPKEEYDLVLILNVLHFFNLKEIKLIIKKAIKSLRSNGLLYLKVFSTKDPAYNKKINVHFFTKEELTNFFSRNKVLETEEITKEENHPPLGKHRHGIINVIVKK